MAANLAEALASLSSNSASKGISDVRAKMGRILMNQAFSLWKAAKSVTSGPKRGSIALSNTGIALPIVSTWTEQCVSKWEALPDETCLLSSLVVLDFAVFDVDHAVRVLSDGQ